jgi:hypothetical protein
MPGPVVLRRAAALAAEAVVVTYPLVLMDLARRQLTATRTAGPLRAPVNQFAHMPRFTLATSAPVITPNVDTVTSSAWLDLSAEPLVLSLPDTGGRYYAMPIYDAWTTAFATLGARTTGTRAREYVLAGVGWKGRLPRGMAVVQSPTSLAWILGHVRSDGSRDDEEVQRLQQQIRLTPFSRWSGDAGSDHDPPVAPPAVVASPVAQVSRMDPHEYFGRVARLLMDNPPHRADRARVERMAGLGVGPGQPPSWSRHDRLLVREIARGMADGLAQLEATAARAVQSAYSWSCPSELARRPADPLLRAACAWTGLGTWPRRDGLVYTTDADSHGAALTGDHSYVLRLPPGATPPARAFWSLTAHPRDALTRPHARARLAVGDRDPLSPDPDGSLTIRVQPDPPDVDHANWLPAPAGPFGLALRIYWPEPAALDGSWRPPALVRVSGTDAGSPAEAPAKVAGTG